MLVPSIILVDIELLFMIFFPVGPLHRRDRKLMVVIVVTFVSITMSMVR